MTERTTKDLPAAPDPDYVYHNPEYEQSTLDQISDESCWDVFGDFMDDFSDPHEQTESKQTKTYDFFNEKLFADTNARAYIDEYAAYDTDGRLNMDLTSLKTGIPYNFNMMGRFALGQIVGLPGDPDPDQKLEIHLDRSRYLHQLTYGHEIGHYYWNVVLGRERQAGIEESFCDYFGRRIALPEHELKKYKEIDEDAIFDMMTRFRVELDHVILALMEYDMLPPKVAIDTYNPEYANQDYSEKVVRYVICQHCTRVGGDYSCPNNVKEIPLYDLTDRAWGGTLSGCLGEDLYKPPILSTLTKHYQKNEEQLLLFRPRAPF